MTKTKRLDDAGSLKCERPHRLPPLASTEVERRSTGFIEDCCAVWFHVFRDPANYPPNVPAMEVLFQCITERRFPPLDVLNRVVSYVLFFLPWTAESRPLTTEEEEVLAAAWRISDALHGPRR
jgi:hypothetical protein